MNPDEELTEQQQRIARMADAMLARGQSVAKVQDFVNRAMAREATNRREAAEVNRPRGALANLAGGVEAFTEGATLGGSGLIGDAALAALDPNQSFGDVRAARKAREQGFRQAHPVASGGLGLTGALTTPALGAGRIVGAAIKGTGRLAKVGRALAPLAAEGAAQAGIESAVRGTEDFTADALKRSLAQGAQSALVGGVAAPVVGGVVGGIASGPVEAIRRFATRGASSAPVRKLAGRLGREGAELVDDAADLMRSPDVTFADVTRGGGRALRAATNLSPAGEDVARTRLNTRGARVGERAEEALTEASGLAPQDVATSVEDLTRARASRAEPLYRAAEAEGVANRMTPRTPELDRFLSEPDIQAIVGRLQQTRQFRDLAPDDPKMLDAVYKALSDKQADLENVIARAQSANQPENIGRFAAEDVRGAKEQALEAMAGPRGPMPSYRPAVTQYAEDSALMRAYQTGVEVFNRPAGEIRAAIAKMTPDEVDLVKRGVVDRMREQIGRGTPNPDLADVARQSKGQGQVNLGKLEARDRLRAIFGDKGYLDLVRAARTEGRFSQTMADALQNSSTAKQLRDMGAFGDLGDDLAQSITLSPWQSVANLGGRVLRRATQSGIPMLGEGTNRELADLMTRPGRGSVEDLMRQVQAELARREAARGTGIRAGRQFVGATRALLPGEDR